MLFGINVFFVRLLGLFPSQGRQIETVKNSPHIKLLFGCGDTRYPGWTGIDCFFGSNVDINLDLRRPLPFDESSVYLCYSEHFLEHLFYD